MVALDLQPAFITRRISNGMPPTAKKSACVEDATEKCRISDMQGVRFWAQFLLCWFQAGFEKRFFFLN